MACKQGIRKSMEASRAYYERLKEYDPFRELWTSLVHRSSKDQSLSSFSRDEKIYFAVGLLDGEVCNGGLDQFFWNSSGDYCQIALEGLDEIGAQHSLEILAEATTMIFGRAGAPTDRRKRWQVLNSKTKRALELLTGHRKRSRLEALDKQFWADPDGLNDRLMAFAHDRGLITPFLKEGGS